jgi:hypothetical protein
MLPRLLKDAGFKEVTSKPFSIDASYGSNLHYACCKDTQLSMTLLKNYLMKAGVEDIEYDACLVQLQLDMLQEEFASVSFGLQAWGRKPA